MQYYIDYLKNSISGKIDKEAEEEDEENTISKQLRDLWNKREITIINNIILELEENRKKNNDEFQLEQDALIKTLETLLNRKEQKVSNILFENTTLLI